MFSAALHNSYRHTEFVGHSCLAVQHNEGRNFVCQACPRIEVGERAAIIGPNSAGETTLLRILEALDLALENCPGTQIFVSHDREFVSSLATRIIDMKSTGLVDFKGNYEDYLRSQEIYE